jgi:thiol-disulfide isomerase/thioredoxin
MMRAVFLFAILLTAAAFAQDEKPSDAPLALVGKPAPDFKLDLLDGGQMKLADHKGKNVVILDFWATWCPPCVAELPLIAEVAKARADKGVVFYAIDEEEEPAEVKQFLEKIKLADLKVPMDKDGAASKAYLVDALPQTVIIGKDGIIKSVHVGLKSKEDFAKALDAALEQK